MSFPTTMGGRYGFEKQTTSAKKQVYGATMALPDGRVFRYVENGGTAIGDGLLVASEAPSADHDEDLTTTTSPAVGDTTIGITFAGSTDSVVVKMVITRNGGTYMEWRIGGAAPAEMSVFIIAG